MLGQEDIDGGFEHACIVNGDHAYFGNSVPTRASTASVRPIHNVIGDKKVRLEKLREPSQGGT